MTGLSSVTAASFTPPSATPSLAPISDATAAKTADAAAEKAVKLTQASDALSRANAQADAASSIGLDVTV